MRAADLWWLHPGRIVCLALLPIYLSFLTFDFTRVVKNVYVPSGLYWWGLALLACTVAGIQWALAHAERRSRVAPPLFSRGVMLLLLGFALMAYAIWFGPLLARPQALMDIVGGQRAEVRHSISTTPGVTTLTQFGVAFAIAYGLKCSAGVQQVSRIEHAGFVVLLLLTLFRAFAWAERLAAIEYLVCFGVARMAFLPIVQPAYRRAAQVLPAAAALALYGVFTASEYFRSWEHYVNQYDSIWAFTLDRLVTYYATATNNGIGVLVETHDWPYYNGAFAFKSVWIMPGLGAALDAAFGNPRGIENDFLDIFARPEFNSPTAYFRVVMDFGYAGSALFFLLFGWLIGQAYAAFRCGRLFGLLLFPVFVLFLSESLRYSYFAETRCVPLLLGLGILLLDVRRQRWLTLKAWSRRDSPALRP
jgi:oligosaccharide repeat unit polymerase